MLLLNKLSGDHQAIPPRPPAKVIALAWLGSALAIGIIACFQDWLSLALLLSSFGASSLLVFGYPDYPFAQPRNVILGHFLSSLSGVLCLYLFGDHNWSMGIAVGTAVAAMMLARAVHPPSASNPIVIFAIKASWVYLFFPTLVGAILLVIIGLIYNNSTRIEKYPKFW